MATLAPSFLIEKSSSYLQVTMTTINSRQSLNLGQIRQPTAELAALENLEKSTKTYNGIYVVATQAPSFWIEPSFLQVMRTCINA